MAAQPLAAGRLHRRRPHRPRPGPPRVAAAHPEEAQPGPAEAAPQQPVPWPREWPSALPSSKGRRPAARKPERPWLARPSKRRTRPGRHHPLPQHHPRRHRRRPRRHERQATTRHAIAAVEARPTARALATERAVDDEQHQPRPAHHRGRTGAGDILPTHPPRRPARPVAHSTRHPGRRRRHSDRGVLRWRRDTPGLQRPNLGTRRRTDLDTCGGPTDRGMATHRLLVGLAHHGRATAVPTQDRRPTPRRHARTPRRHGQATRVHRPRHRSRDDPRLPPSNPDRDVRSHTSRIRAPRPRRTRTPRHLLGQSPRHCVPHRTNRNPPSPRTHPPRLRHRPGRMVGSPRHPRPDVGRKHLRRTHRPRRTRW